MLECPLSSHTSCNQRHLVNLKHSAAWGCVPFLGQADSCCLTILRLAEASSDKNASPLVSVGVLAAPAAPLPATVTCLVLAPGHPEGSG